MPWMRDTPPLCAGMVRWNLNRQFQLFVLGKLFRSVKICLPGTTKPAPGESSGDGRPEPLLPFSKGWKIQGLSVR